MLRPGRPGDRTAGATVIGGDFTRDHSVEVWAPRVTGVDVVINTVGILREHGAQSFAAVHVRAPCALFAAAAQAGVRLIVQISALGADADARSRYHLSKKQADDFLAALPVPSAIVQPSLVFGSDGASARLFALLASLPLVPLPGGGRQRIQPLHVDDLTAAILHLLAQPPAGSVRLTLAGPRALALRDYLQVLRGALGLGSLRVLPVPVAFARGAAQLSALLPHALLDRETLQMLERGNTADPAPLRALLGRAPRAPERFIAPHETDWLRMRARLDWLLPVLRVAVALVWIVTGIVSFGLYPAADSYALLARTGVPPALAPLLLYGAAALDLAIGIGILVLRRRAWLWLAQAALILLYTAIISVRLPEFWLHPYGPILKNLPMLAVIWVLYEFEK